MRTDAIERAGVEIDPVIHSVIAVAGRVAAIAEKFPVANESWFLAAFGRKTLGTVPAKTCEHGSEARQQDSVHWRIHNCIGAPAFYWASSATTTLNRLTRISRPRFTAGTVGRIRCHSPD